MRVWQRKKSRQAIVRVSLKVLLLFPFFSHNCESLTVALLLAKIGHRCFERCQVEPPDERRQRTRSRNAKDDVRVVFDAEHNGRNESRRDEQTIAAENAEAIAGAASRQHRHCLRREALFHRVLDSWITATAHVCYVIVWMGFFAYARRRVF